jgi:tetrahydromethanopterin S-methyltransferase subunit G
MIGVDKEDLNRIHDRLNEIDDKLNGISSQQAAILARCGPCRDRIERHDLVLFGNGKKGLVETVGVLAARRSEVSLKSLGIIIGTVAGIVGAAIGAVAAVWK